MIEYVAPALAVTQATPAPVIEYVAHTPAVTYATPAPLMECVTPSPMIEYATPASEPQIEETPPFVNVTVPQIVEETGDVISERVQQRPAEHTEGVPQMAVETVEIEAPFPSRSFVPEDVDAEILGHEKAIRHYHGHID